VSATQDRPATASARHRRLRVRLLAAGVSLAVAACAIWAAAHLWTQITVVGEDFLLALWTLPLIVGLHLGQLLLSAVAWRGLLARSRAGLGLCFRLRLVREGLNTLLPVAHVGGEMVAVQLLARRGIPVAQGAASVIVDVTTEVCSQVLFLLAGCLVLARLSGTAPAWLWAGSIGTALLAAGGLLLALRFGALRLLEAAVDGIGRRFPALSLGGLDGLHAAARAIYRRPRRLAAAVLLQGTAWVMGVGETWLVLRALGVPASLPQCFVVESLGAAARSAGFAVPGALAVQEGGYVLAAAAIGLPELPAFTLSLVKRAREILIGLAGLAIWRLARGARPSYRVPAGSEAD
jgi:putative membrane protein